ncbi:hypothetical protein Bbelb_079990 [Branchiostoma belcheri]|nr:hypothetical protein Bbelb_079990 [Branchiostoma belcheri]
MAENLPSNTVPKAIVVRNEFFGEGMAKPDTGTLPSTFRQAAEGASQHISGRCEGNKDNDDENLSDTSDAAAENIHTIDIGPGEFDTYAIAYICKEQSIRMKKTTEETKNKPFHATKTAPDNTNNDNDTETSTFKANDSNLHTQARDPNPMYTQNIKPQTMYAANDVNPNPMYLQSSPGPTFMSNKSDDNPCTQTSTDTHQHAFSRPATNNDDNHCLQPYAVTRLQQDDEAASMKMPEDNEDSAAYMCQGDVECGTASGDTQASLSSQNQNQPTAASNSINDVSTSPSSNDVLHALDPNPMYAAADMVRGDVGWHTDLEDTQASLSSQNLPAAASNNVNDANDVLHTRSLSLLIIKRQAATGCDVKQERISFGGYGEEPGKFQNNFGVAVSADNEIFVTDQFNKRVQVFRINGTFIRLFPTVVPGERPGYLWVLGRRRLLYNDTVNEGHVVQYSNNGRGQPIKKFDVSLKGYFAVIAMDVRNNKVIVFRSASGILDKGSHIGQGENDGIGGVTSDKEGNVLLTDGRKTIQKYNPSGVKIFEFRTSEKVGWQLSFSLGICLDISGRIIVAKSGRNNLVDMFTSQGEFVRTIAYIDSPRGVAMGPCGELVVTSPNTNTVTIFPRHMVLP